MSWEKPCKWCIKPAIMVTMTTTASSRVVDVMVCDGDGKAFQYQKVG